MTKSNSVFPLADAEPYSIDDVLLHARIAAKIIDAVKMAKYCLPEEVRKQLVVHPERRLSRQQLAKVRNQRQRFIRRHGHDGFGERV